MAHPGTDRSTLPAPLSSHMIKHHLRARDVTTHVEGGERDRELRLAGQLEIEMGDTVRGIVAAARDNDLAQLERTLPYLRHVTQDHYLELLNEPLDAAAFANNTACVELLLTWGADPNRLFNGKPASVVAAGEGNAESLEIIMAHGCNLDRQDQGGHTPLMTATQHGHNVVARMLIDAGANRDMASVPGGKTALMIASERGNVALCRALLEPAGKNWPGPGSGGGGGGGGGGGQARTGSGEGGGCHRDLQENHLGYTAMMFAARRDFAQLVDMLYNFGADVHARDHDGRTAMHHAAHFNRLRAFRFLWTLEGCVNDRDDAGMTPLMVGVQRSMRGVVELAVGTFAGFFYPRRDDDQQGGEEEEEDGGGQPRRGRARSLSITTADAMARDVRALAEDMDLEAQDNQGRTALMWAVLNCHLVFVRMLMVDGGASLEPRDNAGKTALDHAKALRLPDMCMLLEQCVLDRADKMAREEAARIAAEKAAAKAARKAALSDSEFDFTSSEEEEEEEEAAAAASQKK